MRLLKILTLTFCFFLFSSHVFAQSKTVQPKFGIGISLGLPTGLHVFARDMGIRGLGIRVDIGGLLTPVGSGFYPAVNVEYHFAHPRGIGFYVGFGLFALKGIGQTSTFPSTEYPWLFGVQGYIGFELGVLFLELGWMESFFASDGMSNRSSLRGGLGLQFYF
jgi:hypothetical protein